MVCVHAAHPLRTQTSTLHFGGERVLGRTRQLVRGLCKASIPLGGARCGAKDCGSSGGGAPRSRCCAATPLHRAYHVTALGLMTLQGRAGQQDPTRTGSTARSAHPAHVSDSAPSRGAGPSRPSSSSSPWRVCLDPRAGLPGLPRPPAGPTRSVHAMPGRAAPRAVPLGCRFYYCLLCWGPKRAWIARACVYVYACVCRCVPTRLLQGKVLQEGGGDGVSNISTCGAVAGKAVGVCY